MQEVWAQSLQSAKEKMCCLRLWSLQEDIQIQLENQKFQAAEIEIEIPI